MNISSTTGSGSPQFSPQIDSSDGSREIKDLEKKKAQLEQEMEDENNPFATRQSDKYAQLKKQIGEIEQQIQQKKAEASKKTDSVSSASLSFDQYEQGKDPLTSGTYGEAMDKDGKRVMV